MSGGDSHVDLQAPIFAVLKFDSPDDVVVVAAAAAAVVDDTPVIEVFRVVANAAASRVEAGPG